MAAEPKPCSRLLICLQINQQTIAGKVVARNAALTGGLPPDHGLSLWFSQTQRQLSQRRTHVLIYDQGLRPVHKLIR
jgi:hypothetical protein